MNISNGLKMLELQIESFGGRQELSPTLIWEDRTAVLIDTGTPGHTPGHISLYLKRSKTLVAGDSMYSVEGVLCGPNIWTSILKT